MLERAASRMDRILAPREDGSRGLVKVSHAAMV
jgi:hypothetical protein